MERSPIFRKDLINKNLLLGNFVVEMMIGHPAQNSAGRSADRSLGDERWSRADVMPSVRKGDVPSIVELGGTSVAG